MSDMVLSAVEEMSVVDVYDLASDIGKECEKIIDGYGADAVTSLMPKVITVLELLEAMATRNETENTRMQELTDRIAHLESERQEKAVFRERFEKELEAIEEQWRSETNDLMTMVSRLQDENRRILKQQNSGSSSPNSSPSHHDDIHHDMADKLKRMQLQHAAHRPNTAADSQQQQQQQAATDVQVLQRLRAQLEKQRNDVKLKDIDLQAKSADVDNLNVQLDRLTNSGRESRKRQKLLQVQVRSLVEERADFLAQLQDQHREINAMKRRLGIAEKENEDLAKGSESEDPHRARFSTAELKDILNERDELKLQLVDLVEELKAYKPKDELSAEEKLTEEDPPVQGPLPYEPDDAPWKKGSESGIRKFFRKLFSEPGTSTFPRRSLSTLSKMALSASDHSDII